MDDILRLKDGDALFVPEGDCAEVSQFFGQDSFVIRRELAKLRKLTPGKILLCAQNLISGD